MGPHQHEDRSGTEHPGGARSRGGSDEASAREVGAPDVVRRHFDGMPVMLVGLEGPEFRFGAVNRVYREFFGRSDLIGVPMTEVFPELENQQIVEMCRHVYTTGEPERRRAWRLQLSRGPVEEPEDVFLDFSVAPERDSGGAVTGLSFYLNDVTERVRARQAAQREAVEAQRRYAAAREVVAQLQEALLPTGLPVLPDAVIGARYLVAAQDQAAGGDWFDAMTLADGTVALVVGDVVGHGVRASATMGQLRAVLKHQLATAPDLATAVSQVDSFAAAEPPARAATLAVALLDPACGELRYSLCGHPPPLVLHADGSTAFLPGTGTGPLGVGHTPAVATARLEPGALLLLYSDGLVERPNRTVPESSAELATVAADAAANRALPRGATASTAERVCQLTVELLTRTGYTDDVTTLAAQRLRAPVAPLSMELGAVPGSLHTALDGISSWLTGIRGSDDDHDVLTTAVGEAVSNAIEHAYPAERPGTVRLTAELRQDGICECQVSDHGRWRTADPTVTRRGRGLLICERLLDEVVVTHPPQRAGEPAGARGTTVTLRHRLHHPAMLASEGGGATTAGATDEAGAEFAATLDADGDAYTLRVSGPVDITTADAFARELSTASRGGVLPLTVDLTKVAHLASAGVQALYEAVDRSAANHQPLVLHAEPGTPAALVLDLVRLPGTAGTG